MNYLRKRMGLPVLFCLLSLSYTYAQAPAISSTIGFPVNLRSASAVAYGNGKYVVLEGYNYTGLFNTVYQSSTGAAWTRINATGLVTTPLNYIAFGAGVFVVIGNNGVIETSTDGVSWTPRASGTSNSLIKVYFENSTFYAIGFNRTLLTSANGITWTTIAFSTGIATDLFVSIAYGNGVYIIAARSTTGGPGANVYRSATGASNSWTYAAGTPGTNLLNRIQFLNNKFFAFTSGNTMFNSANGTTWTDFTSSVVLTQPNSTTSAWTTSHQIFNGVWDGAKYSFYGSSAYYSGYGSTFTSTDGSNLTLLARTAYIVPQESKIINGIYFVCGNEGIVSSTDGVTYMHSGPSARDMVKTAAKFVSVGMISQTGQIYNSTDFNTWTDRTPDGVRELYSAAYDGTRVLATGSGVILSSVNDGDSWTTVPGNVNETIAAIAYGNGRFVGGGYHNSTGAFLRYSTDGGQSWTPAGNFDDYYIKIKYINNRFFAFVTDNTDYLGRILYSTDGISWTDVTPNLGYEVLYYKDVAFDGTRYHFWGMESSGYLPVGFFTVSTATPSNSATYSNKATISNTPAGAVLGGTYDEGVLDYANGKFTGAVIDVSTGQDYIIYSADGSSWTALPQNSAGTITASYLNGQTVQMIGRANAFFTANYNIALPVSISRFEGHLREGAVQLGWTTASEQNSRQFVVEHSTDGRHWNAIGTVAAAGTATLPQTYSLTHTSPAEGINFYRLLLQDVNGASAQSRVVSINVTGKQTIECYPNPATDRVTVRTSSDGRGQILLYNASGQPVRRAIITGYQTSISLAGLPGGTYIAEVIQGGRQQRVTLSRN